jgi:flagellin-like protein
MRQATTEQKGQVGIGTLIVFIAMVLVAAIAAAVLVNTAGFLQSQAEQTGQEATDQVSNRIQVQSASGNYGGSDINEIDLVVSKAPGSENVDISAATLVFNGPSSVQTINLTSSSVTSTVVDKGSTSPVLSDSADRFVVKLGGSGATLPDNLGAGEVAEVTLVTGSGAESTAYLQAPDTLADLSTGDDVSLD